VFDDPRVSSDSILISSWIMDIPLDAATTEPDEEIQDDKPRNGN
jgi:hypothetical protein